MKNPIDFSTSLLLSTVHQSQLRSALPARGYFLPSDISPNHRPIHRCGDLLDFIAPPLACFIPPLQSSVGSSCKDLVYCPGSQAFDLTWQFPSQPDTRADFDTLFPPDFVYCPSSSPTAASFLRLCLCRAAIARYLRSTLKPCPCLQNVRKSSVMVF